MSGTPGRCFDVYGCNERRRTRDEPEHFKQLRALGEEMRSSGGVSWCALLASGDVAMLSISAADGEQKLGRAGVPWGPNWQAIATNAWTERDAERREHKAALDAVYEERDKCVALIAAMARALAMPAGLGHHDPNDASWDAAWRNIVFVELPTGQVSWHIHDRELPWFAGLGAYAAGWDGHTTEEKYERVLEAARGVASMAGNDRWKENYSYLYTIIEMRNARIAELEAAAGRIPFHDPWLERVKGAVKAALGERLDEIVAEDEAKPWTLNEACEEVERLRNVIRTGGAMYRAERATMGIAGGDDPEQRSTDYAPIEAGLLPVGTRIREKETGKLGVVIMRPPPRYVRVRFDDDEPGGTGHPLTPEEVETMPAQKRGDGA